MSTKKLFSNRNTNIGLTSTTNVIGGTHDTKTTGGSLIYYGTYTPLDRDGNSNGSPITGTWNYTKSDDTYTGTWKPNNGELTNHTCTGQWNNDNNIFTGKCDDNETEEHYGTWKKLTISDIPEAVTGQSSDRKALLQQLKLRKPINGGRKKYKIV